MTGLPPKIADSAQRWIHFSVCGESHAVDIRSVREVLNQAVIEPVPGAPPSVSGVINLRGEIVTVIDFAAWLGLPGRAESRALIVLDNRRVVLALVIDAIHDVLRLEGEVLQAIPAEPEFEGPQYRSAVIEREGKPVSLIDTDALLGAITITR